MDRRAVLSMGGNAITLINRKNLCGLKSLDKRDAMVEEFIGGKY